MDGVEGSRSLNGLKSGLGLLEDAEAVGDVFCLDFSSVDLDADLKIRPRTEKTELL